MKAKEKDNDIGREKEISYSNVTCLLYIIVYALSESRESTVN